jgi:hypothetical protein
MVTNLVHWLTQAIIMDKTSRLKGWKMGLLSYWIGTFITIREARLIGIIAKGSQECCK